MKPDIRQITLHIIGTTPLICDARPLIYHGERRMRAKGYYYDGKPIRYSLNRCNNKEIGK